MSFILLFNNGQDVEKLKKLQNRSLRLCYNINNPVNIRTSDLHDQAKICKLQSRMNLSLLCIMFDLKQNNMYRETGNRRTRANDGYNPEQRKTGHVSPDTYPRTYTTLDTYPLDNYPLDIYPLGHIPLGHIPPII